MELFLSLRLFLYSKLNFFRYCCNQVKQLTCSWASGFYTSDFTSLVFKFNFRTKYFFQKKVSGKASKMALRPHHYALLIVIVCLLVFIVINSKFYVSYRFSESSVEGKNEQKIQNKWSYKLNLTSNFIPITDKTENLFSKLKSNQVNTFINIECEKSLSIYISIIIF